MQENMPANQTNHDINQSKLKQSQTRLTTLVAKWISAQTSLTEVRDLSNQLAKDISEHQVGEIVKCHGVANGKPCKVTDISGSIAGFWTGDTGGAMAYELVVLFSAVVLKRDGSVANTFSWKTIIPIK
jgi:hypothetical protein